MAVAMGWDKFHFLRSVVDYVMKGTDNELVLKTFPRQWNRPTLKMFLSYLTQQYYFVRKQAQK